MHHRFLAGEGRGLVNGLLNSSRICARRDLEHPSIHADGRGGKRRNGPVDAGVGDDLIVLCHQRAFDAWVITEMGAATVNMFPTETSKRAGGGGRGREGGEGGGGERGGGGGEGGGGGDQDRSPSRCAW